MFKEDIQPGYAPKEISFMSYTTKNLHHSADAAKAFQSTIEKLKTGVIKNPQLVKDALMHTDQYMKLNDMHLEQGKAPDDQELVAWRHAHNQARIDLERLGEFLHHQDYWHNHGNELEAMETKFTPATAGNEFADSYQPEGNLVEATRFATAMKSAIAAHERGDHKRAKYHLDNAKEARYSLKSTELGKHKELLDKYQDMASAHKESVKEELTNKTIKPADKIKVARVIADMLGVENAESLSPDVAVAQGLRKIKTKRLTPEFITTVKKMVSLAREVGIKVDDNLLPQAVKESIEESHTEFRIDHSANPSGDVKSTFADHGAKVSDTTDKATYVKVPSHKADAFKQAMKNKHNTRVELAEEPVQEAKETLSFKNFAKVAKLNKGEVPMPAQQTNAGSVFGEDKPTIVTDTDDTDPNDEDDVPGPNSQDNNPSAVKIAAKKLESQGARHTTVGHSLDGVATSDQVRRMKVNYATQSESVELEEKIDINYAPELGGDFEAVQNKGNDRVGIMKFKQFKKEGVIQRSGTDKVTEAKNKKMEKEDALANNSSSITNPQVFTRVGVAEGAYTIGDQSMTHDWVKKADTKKLQDLHSKMSTKANLDRNEYQTHGAIKAELKKREVAEGHVPDDYGRNLTTSDKQKVGMVADLMKREKEHKERMAKMNAAHAQGKEDMSGAIDRLEKHLNKEEIELEEQDLSKMPTDKLKAHWNQHKDEQRPSPTFAMHLKRVAGELKKRKALGEEIELEEDVHSADYKVNPQTGRKYRAKHIEFANSKMGSVPSDVEDRSNDETDPNADSIIRKKKNEPLLKPVKEEVEDEYNFSEKDLDDMVDEIKDEEDVMDAYDEDELVIIDQDTGEVVDEVKEEVAALNEVLSRMERMKAKMRFARTSSKRARRLKVALKTHSSMAKINSRARRLAVKLMKQRIAKKPLAKMSVSEKERVERIVARRKNIINRLALKLAPRVRRIENERLSHKK